MIRPDRLQPALRAIQSFLVAARSMAYAHEEHARLADLLDTAEYLPSLLLEPTDRTEACHQTLRDLAARYPACGVALGGSRAGREGLGAGGRGTLALVPSFPLALLYPNALRAVHLQVERLGQTFTEAEMRRYLAGPGPVAEFEPDGAAYNPRRTKDWHLGRVKFFYLRFQQRLPVDPIRVGGPLPGLGCFANDGAHRVLGAYCAGRRTSGSKAELARVNRTFLARLTKHRQPAGTTWVETGRARWGFQRTPAPG